MRGGRRRKGERRGVGMPAERDVGAGCHVDPLPVQAPVEGPGAGVQVPWLGGREWAPRLRATSTTPASSSPPARCPASGCSSWPAIVLRSC